MPYESFSIEATAFVQSPAYRAIEMRRALHEISGKKFSVQGDRDGAKEILTNLNTHFEIAAINQRFPGDGLFLFLDISDWNKRWQDLNSALDYKSSEKDPKSKKWENSQLGSGNGSDSPSTRESWNYDDASMVFRNTIRLMSDQLGRRDGLFDRTTFESRFGLIWKSPSNCLFVKDSLRNSLRLRQFYINPLAIHNGNWPGVANTVSLFDIDDDIPFNDDFVYFWSGRANDSRCLFTFEVRTGMVIYSIVQATAD